jgi:hypothetical protein
METEELEVLLACARESSQEAIGALVVHFTGPIVLLVNACLDPGLRGRLDAEEIAQEVLADFFTNVLNSESCPVAAALGAYL